ncbi:MAG: hypothetical protein K9M51_00235 [Candidatus Gracilibacteria bacterium]|nr:hypothetical protein [Candidatus Gracilibacteria bacterium]
MPVMTAAKTKRFAFVQKNFRALSFESRMLLGTHAGTLLFCFFPWIGVQPLYGEPYFHSAFEGHTWLMGTFIFLISLAVVGLFLDELLEKHWFRWKVSKNKLFFVAGVQEIILLISIWSVLNVESRGFENAQIRFGFLLCVLLQVVGLVAVYLRARQAKKEQVVSFFQNAAHPKKEAPSQLPLTDPDTSSTKAPKHSPKQ